MSRFAATLAAALLALLAAASLATAAPAPRTTLNDVEDEVMCVSCGVPLNIAESPQADRERALIQRLVNQGLTKPQVKARLVDEFGPRVLAEPKDNGFGVAAYAVPIVLVLALVTLVAVLVPRWRRNRDATAAAAAGDDAGPALSAADARRLDEDLARYEV